MPSSLDQVSETNLSSSVIVLGLESSVASGLSQPFLVPFQLSPSFSVPVHK